ncbi:MAG: DNA repair protein RecO [Firmicutes bacterium]|nr:DNA repair protein RecO [Bacillota bacterium]MCL2771469.1 DNA repair protein RecO [Bacillota bacterium]
MKEIKDNIIVIKSTPIANGKQVVFFGENFGKKRASVKGESTPSSKLKMATQPFCFLEAVFFERETGVLSFKTIEVESTNLEIAKDFDRLTAASLVLEVLETSSMAGEPNALKFHLAKIAISKIAAGVAPKGDPLISALWFMLKTIEMEGYGTANDFKINDKITQKILVDIESHDISKIDFIKPNEKELNLLKKYLKEVYFASFGATLNTI